MLIAGISLLLVVVLVRVSFTAFRGRGRTPPRTSRTCIRVSERSWRKSAGGCTGISRHPAADLTLKRAKARAPERGIHAASPAVVRGYVENCMDVYLDLRLEPWVAVSGIGSGVST